MGHPAYHPNRAPDHSEVGLSDRAVGVGEAKLEHGGLHLVGCP